VGIASLPDMRAHAEMIANLNPSIPLIADMDTGYGGPIMVSRSVEAYVRSGVAGFHIEDQVQSKRCGHLLGKQLVSLEVFLSRIRAAAATRKRLGSDIVIIARTDALQSLGYDESLARLKAARDAGADAGFLEGVTSKEMCRQIIKDVAPWPMLLNMVEHGATPTISRDEAKEMGFKIMIWPFAGLAPAFIAMRECFERVKKTGLAEAPAEVTPRKIFEVCGLDDSMKIDEEAGGETFVNGA
jgi:2-methylisocitrate lyase-like PEP mutase family enzyme